MTAVPKLRRATDKHLINAEEALSHAYYLITGRSPEWSNVFGHVEALEEIDDAQRLLRQRISQREWQPIETAPKDGTRIVCANENAIWLDMWSDVGVFKVPNFIFDRKPATRWCPLPAWSVRKEP